MDDLSKVRLEKLQKLEELGVIAYPYEFNKTHEFKDIIAKYKEHSSEELEKVEQIFNIAGRIIALRKMGKSSFLHLFDGEEKLQIYVRQDMMPEKDYAVYKLLDIGDIIGVSGKLFRTHSNELTLLVNELTFLSKSIHPLPEKWHGLQDKEMRYRQRYLDLIVNPDTRNVFNLRSGIIQQIRMFFYQRGYLEVETPMMQPIAGGASARPFVTRHNALGIELYLRIAPELYLKRLLVGGMEKVFEINRNFRNEGISMKHNPEFTMLEFYQLYKDFNYYMELTENLISILNKEFLTDEQIVFQGQTVSLKPPYPRKKYMELICEKAGICLEDLWDEAKLKAFIEKNLPAEDMPPTYGKMLELVFDHYVESSLQEPTFVTYFPKAISPLSKKSRLDPRETERFELYIAGMEVANGFSELNDPLDQRGRFEAQVKDREKGDDEAQLIDNDFLTALEYGMAPAAGEGIGIDRLIMLYSGVDSIKEVILFPLLRPKTGLPGEPGETGAPGSGEGGEAGESGIA
ncbi:MAG TPA: lysine--tRNA ligase [Candidatus Kapabacteria bacterium]|nr:lysine--tRNA ligase [Candidatus Kapabacteria bacterium]